jgi:alpha-tubulin suppressor-like RCC1 family protein
VVEVVYQGASVSRSYPLAVASPNIALELEPLPEQQAPAGAPFTLDLRPRLFVEGAGAASVDPQAVAWNIVGGALPSGLALSQGVISGTPRSGGTARFTVQASYAQVQAQATYTLFFSTPPAAFSAISVGWAHACGITALGAAQCWGDNRAGQLGNGTVLNSSVPVQVAGLTSGVVHISAGRWHTCAVTVDGAVFCWGDNSYGELGDGTTTSRTTPVPVSGIPQKGAEVAAGLTHTCAIVSNKVYCWGDNSYGELGRATPGQSSTPLEVKGLIGAARGISAGYGFTCFAPASGRAACWGLGGSGQLGNGYYASSASPVQVTGASALTGQISAGFQHACLAGTDASIQCWGDNSAEQLGIGQYGGSVPALTPVAGAPTGFSQISAGFQHSCALRNDGRAFCWGLNTMGELGTGAASAAQAQVGAPIVSGEAITQVEAGYRFTCALQASGKVICFGQGDSGQLGDGRSQSSATARVVASGF